MDNPYYVLILFCCTMDYVFRIVGSIVFVLTLKRFYTWQKTHEVLNQLE